MTKTPGDVFDAVIRMNGLGRGPKICILQKTSGSRRTFPLPQHDSLVKKWRKTKRREAPFSESPRSSGVLKPVVASAVPTHVCLCDHSEANVRKISDTTVFIRCNM